MCELDGLFLNAPNNYHLIQAKVDEIKQESVNLSTLSPNVSRRVLLFSHNPSEKRRWNQAERPIKSICYS
jgi:hypothetical protein